jgi:tRNA (guanine-N7-)-methyltransferase
VTNHNASTAPCATHSTADHTATASDPLAKRTVKSFVRRAGRTTSGQAKAALAWGPRFLVPYQAAPLDWDALFATPTAPQQAPTAPAKRVILEIGFGMGEASARIAAQQPDTCFLCCEVHPPGVGALLQRIAAQSLHNIRIVAHDAVDVVAHMVALRSLDGIHIFFPDPWPKKRHHKRRLIQPDLVAQLAARLKPGGYLHCATDWQAYAEQMLAVLGQEPLLVNRALQQHPDLLGYAPKPDYRPLTKFEQRGLQLGHGVWDVVYERLAS